MPNKWLTPDQVPNGTKCIKLIVPNGDEWEAIVRGALAPLLVPANFEEHGGFTPEETAEVFADALAQSFSWDECT